MSLLSSVTPATHDGTRLHAEPYYMWRRASTCLLWKTTPADMLRVDNTEHTQPILFMTVTALPNDGIDAKDIEVCLWLLFNVFRVNALSMKSVCYS